VRNFIFIIIGFTIIFTNTWGAFIENSLFVVPWGNGANELKLETPTHNYNPDDSADDVDPGAGPDNAIIDKDGNIILSSYALRQIKGFDPTGNLLFGVSAGETPNYHDFCNNMPGNIFVDSSLSLYVQSYPFISNITVFGYDLKEPMQIYPFPDSQNDEIVLMKWSPSGKIYFREKKHGWISLYNGQYFQEGYAGTLMSNGYFYEAYNKEAYPNNLFIGKYADIDTLGHPGYGNTKTIELSANTCDTLMFAQEMPGGDGNSLYILASMDSCNSYYSIIWQYDLDFNKIEELKFPNVEDSGYMCPNPVIGPDGSIYEFRTYSDGLHVIKWTKK
jgi:hypothetical protein